MIILDFASRIYSNQSIPSDGASSFRRESFRAAGGWTWPGVADDWKMCLRLNLQDHFAVADLSISVAPMSASRYAATSQDI
jgi:hypothetical protein